MRVLIQTTPTKWGEDVYNVFYGKEAVEYKENASHLLNGRLHYFTSIVEARAFIKKVKEEAEKDYKVYDEEHKRSLELYGSWDIDEDE